MLKMLIGIDIDEVIVRFIWNFIIWHNLTFGTNVRYEDLLDYLNLDHLFGLEPCGLNPRFHEFVRQYGLTIPPMDGAIEAIDFIRTKSKLISITGRQLDVREDTKKYFEKYLHGKFEDIILCNQFRSDVVGTKKVQICLERGVQLMIDDSWETAVECAEQGIKVLLFGDYAWNRQPIPLHLQHLIFRVPDWAAVVKHFERYC